MSAQTAIIIIGILGITYLYNKNVKDIKKELLIAATISFFWVYLSGLYNYSDADYTILGLNLFPFIAWTSGLVALRELYELLPRKNAFLNISIIYTIGIIALEWIGYNIWNIQLSTNYPGLWGYELMHMPWWAQFYYLNIGIVYIYITNHMKVK